MNFPPPNSPRESAFSASSDLDFKKQMSAGKENVVFVVAAADLALADRPAGVKDNHHVQITDHKMAAELNAAGKLTMVTSAGALYGPKVSPIAKKAFEEGVANIHLADGCVLKNVKGRQATEEEYKKFLSVFMASIKPIQDQHDPDKK